jgi:hypothetical protein
LEKSRELNLHSSQIKSEAKSARDPKQKYFFIVNDDKRQEYVSTIRNKEASSLKKSKSDNKI